MLQLSMKFDLTEYSRQELEIEIKAEEFDIAYG